MIGWPLWRNSTGGKGSADDCQLIRFIVRKPSLNSDTRKPPFVTVPNRPIFATRASPKPPVGRSQILELEDYKAAVGDLNQTAKSGPPHFGFSDRNGMDSRLIVFMIARPRQVLRSLDAASAESRVSVIRHQLTSANCKVSAFESSIPSRLLAISLLDARRDRP